MPELDKIPVEVYGIYIIPFKAYNGFWGKNGYNSFDFVLCGRNKEYGWLHWEGDVINIFNNIDEYALSLDSPAGTKYIRLFSNYELNIDDLFISSTTIKVTNRILKGES